MQLTFFLASVLFLCSASLSATEGPNQSTECPDQCLQPQFPPGDVRNCPTHSPQNQSQALHRMEVLPGGGFDNLRNLDMGQVHFYNYSTCRISNDGKYLLPDNIFLIPVQESRVEVFAEFFDYWDKYTSMTASSINFHAGFFSVVSGKFSSGYMSTKSHQVNDESQTTRVQVRHKLYAVKIQPDAQLHPTFKSRVFDIAGNLQNNNTGFAHYLAELLVRDYGTHTITSLDAGAVISQVDHIKSDYVRDQYSYSTKITASASANFFGKVSFGTTFEHSTSENDTSFYISNRTHSEIYTFGGPPFRPNFTINDWENGIPDALVAIDRSGDPLHFVINPNTLAELPEVTVRQVSDIVYKAINRYYKVNTRHGCTIPHTPNFDFQANIDDGSCEAPETNFTFGGIYQTCEVDPKLNTENLCTSGPEPAAQMNPLTGDYSCPQGYIPVQLHTGTITHVTQKPVCNNVCHHCGWFSRCCHCENVLASFLSAAQYQAYWCVATGTVQENSGLLFGGFYTSTVSNPVTGSMTCPRYFIPLHFGADAKICVSNDYELGYAYSIPFGGFESCDAGNPLAASNATDPSKWPHTCPHGFAQHLVTVDEGCEINYCITTGAFNSSTLLPAKLPPFRSRPQYKVNLTDTLVVFGLYGNIWLKNSDGQWEKTHSGFEDGKSLLATLPDGSEDPASRGSDDGALSNGIVAVISVLATLVLCTLIVIVVFAGCKWRMKKRRKNYRNINGGTSGSQLAGESNI